MIQVRHIVGIETRNRGCCPHKNGLETGEIWVVTDKHKGFELQEWTGQDSHPMIGEIEMI